MHTKTHEKTIKKKVIVKISKPEKDIGIIKAKYEGKGDQKDCKICFQNYEINEELAYLKCMHNFHAECFKKWSKLKPLCPICKVNPFK